MSASCPCAEVSFSIERLTGRESIVAIDSSGPGRRHRWIRWVILALVVIAAGALAAGEASHVYYGTRRAQDTAEFAMFCGLHALESELQQAGPSEDRILAGMAECAAYGDSPGAYDLLGFYLDAEGTSLSQVGAGIPEDVRGIGVVVHAHVPTPLTRFLGLKGWPVERQAEFSLTPE